MPGPAGHYRNFVVAVYCRVYEVLPMKDPAWLAARWKLIASQVRVDKIYLETQRDQVIAEDETIAVARRFFEGEGVRVAGGITLTVNEANRFETFCYTNPVHRRKVEEIAAYTAARFDEVILDDFVFTNCKCERCIEAKGGRTWSEFRIALMRDAMRELVIAPARRANPNVRLIIKFPNWYEHFQGTGYDLEGEPRIFDGIYAGTETRQATYSAQHLQPCQGYQIIRYFENVAPGRLGGGWVDTFSMIYADRYAEQLQLTLMAKAKEITLFDFRLLQLPIEPTHRAPWQGQNTSFDFDAVTAPFRKPDGSLSPELTLARIAGATFEQVDTFLGKLGNPSGLKSYKPYHSSGEDFLHNYLGMIGIPIDLGPEFPENAKEVLLTASAAADPGLTPKIERAIRAGSRVIVTSGLLRALGARGIESIADVRCTERKVVAREFHWRGGGVFASKNPIVLPVLEYFTNDAWELIGCHANSSPLVVEASYGQRNGSLVVLAIPDNFADVYELPDEVLTRLRQLLAGNLPVRLEGPSQVALFLYDNGALVVESFRSEAARVRLVFSGKTREICDLMAYRTFPLRQESEQESETSGAFEFSLAPHSYRVFAAS